MKRGQDKFGRVWKLPAAERCPVCGQPDSCGDCNHRKLPLKDVLKLGGSSFTRSCPCREIDESTKACETCYKNVWGQRTEK